MSLCLCLLRANTCKDLYENWYVDQYMSYLLKFKISKTFLHHFWRYLSFCRCEDGSGLKVHTPKWTLPKMDFFGELMTYQNFEYLPLYDSDISQMILTVGQN